MRGHCMKARGTPGPVQEMAQVGAMWPHRAGELVGLEREQVRSPGTGASSRYFPQHQDTHLPNMGDGPCATAIGGYCYSWERSLTLLSLHSHLMSGW